MRKINNFLIWVCKAFIMIAVPLMTGVVFIQVLLRYIFFSPFAWAEEMARYLLIWISCLGAAYGVKKGIHISILFISNKFKGHVKSGVTLSIHIITIAFFLVCFVEGMLLSFAQWDQMSPGMQIPITWGYLGVPIGFGFMIMFSFEFLIEDVKTIISGKSVYSQSCD